MITRQIREYVSRDWEAARDAKDAYWAERIARFLSSPLMSGLLMTLGMLGILIELYHPSHFAAAGVGLLCLALFFFGHHVTHLAGWEELLLLGIGLALLAVEAFVIPGFGVTGVLGIVAILASLALAIVDLEHVPFHVSWSLGWITQALAIVFGSIAAAAVLIFATGRYLPSTRLGRRFILRAAIGGQPLAPSATPTGIAADDTLVSAELLDRSGRTATVCRPSGKAVIDGRRVDVVAESDYIDKDEPVTVVHVEGARIVVRRQLGGS